jgi:pimeloyl-ACP methyl ester carboxylesterase
MKSRIAGCFICLGIFLTPALTGCRRHAARAVTATAPGYHKVDIGGCSLNMLVAGAGEPVVVLEAGTGDTISSWSKVQPEVAKFTQVIAYDRAGLGMSDPATVTPRTTAQIARELHTALHELRLSPPYVLVGHSMGGFHVRLFAHQFPKEVAGLVLIDPSAEDWSDLLKAEFPDEHARMIAWQTSDHHPPGMRAELAASELSREEARAARVPDIPVVLFTSLSGNPGGTQIMRRLHQQWLQTIPRSTHIETDKSGHYIQLDEPELVVTAIRNMIDPARSLPPARMP